MSGGDSDSSAEKSHEATPRRLEKAREQGDLPQSRDAQTLAVYVGFGIAMALGGGWAAERMGATLTGFLDHPFELGEQLTSPAAADVLAALGAGLAPPLLALLLAPAALMLALLVAQRGIVFVPSRIAWKLSRISPLENAKNKYGARGMVEFAKSVVKLTALGAVVGIAVYSEADRLAQYVWLDAGQAGPLLMHQFGLILTGVLILSAALAGFDVVWQWLHHLKRMRMTHQELKDEGKQSEGDPYMKAQRRERARQIANNRMLNEVPSADVVVANPTHYAVALKWNRHDGSAPVCVAKGVDEIALAIRARAEEAGVPVHEDPPTARALHGLVEIGAEIPPEQYKAVAAAIIFADQMRRKAREAGA
ncbi:MAG TPA: flagellar type III secretion system protein FlhB [Thermohalobaculum sp.]|nr:flagellar type III secretion system protein FlhB [Thermohalobaculum sp.]